MLFSLVIQNNVYAEEFKNPRNTLIENEMEVCLSEDDEIVIQKIAIAEAGNVTMLEMALVMQVVINRIDSDEFPNTAIEIVKQNKQFSTYPDKYNFAEPNAKSKEALEMVKSGLIKNHGELYFEVTKDNTWLRNNKEWLFDYKTHSYYK